MGNICADPKLVGGADVHQTAQSPTIDKGSDELFNMVGGERANEDYEGDLRPTDGDGDGHTVDMGADESPAFVAPPPPPPPTPQCSDLVDNDGDGAIDAADPGCLRAPPTTTRATRRQATWSCADSARSVSSGRTSQARGSCSAGSWPRASPDRRFS